MLGENLGSLLYGNVSVMLAISPGLDGRGRTEEVMIGESYSFVI